MTKCIGRVLTFGQRAAPVFLRRTPVSIAVPIVEAELAVIIGWRELEGRRFQKPVYASVGDCPAGVVGRIQLE